MQNQRAYGSLKRFRYGCAAENNKDFSPSYTSQRRRFKVAVVFLDGDKNISN